MCQVVLCKGQESDSLQKPRKVHKVYDFDVATKTVAKEKNYPR